MLCVTVNCEIKPTCLLTYWHLLSKWSMRHTTPCSVVLVLSCVILWYLVLLTSVVGEYIGLCVWLANDALWQSLMACCMHRGSIDSQSATPSNWPLLSSMHCVGNFVLEFPSINSSAQLQCHVVLRHLGILPAGNKQSRRQVWLPRMRQRDACWAGEVSLKGSPNARLRDRSAVSRFLYIDLWLYVCNAMQCTGQVTGRCTETSRLSLSFSVTTNHSSNSFTTYVHSHWQHSYCPCLPHCLQWDNVSITHRHSYAWSKNPGFFKKSPTQWVFGVFLDRQEK